MASQGRVALVLSEAGGAYQEVLDSTQRHLSHLGGNIAVVPLMASGIESESSGLQGYDLIIAVGVRATQVVVPRVGRTPLLSTLVPRVAFERMKQAHKGGGGFSALFLDQPLHRQMQLARLIRQDINQILVLLGPESASQESGVRMQALKMKLLHHIEHVSGQHEVNQALHRLLVNENKDVLLGLPDSQIYNAGALQSILLATYRNSVPFLGFSAAPVRAGAVAAVYTTPEQIGQQTAELIARNAQTRRWNLPTPQSPRYFRVGFNPAVAQSLGVPVQNEAALLESLQKLEE